MKRIELTFEFLVFESFEELSIEDQKLMNMAIEARGNAYAPYSNFKVGAALLLENNEVVIGNNQENASYPSGLCAERVAVFQASARYPNIAMKKIAIAAISKKSKMNSPAAPCGNCRQSMLEYEQKQKTSIEILMMGEMGKIIKCNSIADLLPFAFDNSFL